MPSLDSARSAPDRQGFVYCLTNPRMPGLVKVGATRKHPLQRAAELGAGTGVPDNFTLAYFRDFSDCFAAETMVHMRFEAFRTNESREFFEVEVGDVVEYLTSISSNGEAQIIASQGVVGGSYGDYYHTPEVETPFAELFATFPDETGARELTVDETRRVRELGQKLRA